MEDVSCENLSPGLRTRSDANQALQLQRMAGSLKFRICVVERSNCPCGEMEGADQLRSSSAAEMCPFFICWKLVFS